MQCPPVLLLLSEHFNLELAAQLFAHNVKTERALRPSYGRTQRLFRESLSDLQFN